jgi:hypothetical protein
MGEDGLGLAHPSRSFRRSFSEPADFGADDLYALLAQLLEIGLRRRVGEHLVVHGGCYEQRPGAGQQERAENVVGQPLRDSGDQIGCGGRHDDEIRFLAEPDMGERSTRVPEGALDRPPRQRLKGGRPYELGCALGENRVHPGPCLDQAAGEDTTLIAGDTA